MTEPTRKTVPLQIKVLGDRQIQTIASTASLDRDGDRILPGAWRLRTYQGNPVVLWAHDHSLPPVARSLDVRVVGGALRTLDEFPPRGIYPLADQVHDLVKAGFITSKSVGFRPLASRPNAEGGRDFTEVELIEHSYVNIPANPDAIVTAKRKGVHDPAALDAFFDTPRGDEVVLELDDDAARIEVDDAAVRAALDTVLRQRVRDEIARQARGLLGTAEEPEYLALADDRTAAPGAGDLVEVDEQLARVIGETFARVTHREVTAALNGLRGRVD